MRLALSNSPQLDWIFGCNAPNYPPAMQRIYIHANGVFVGCRLLILQSKSSLGVQRQISGPTPYIYPPNHPNHLMSEERRRGESPCLNQKYERDLYFFTRLGHFTGGRTPRLGGSYAQRFSVNFVELRWRLEVRSLALGLMNQNPFELWSGSDSVRTLGPLG